MNETETQEGSSSEQKPPNKPHQESSQADGPSTSDSSPKIDELHPIQSNQQHQSQQTQQTQQQCHPISNLTSRQVSNQSSTQDNTLVRSSSILLSIPSNATPNILPADLHLLRENSLLEHCSPTIKPATNLKASIAASISLGITPPLPPASMKMTTQSPPSASLPPYLGEITYCKLHSANSNSSSNNNISNCNTNNPSPSLSNKSIKHRFAHLKDLPHSQSSAKQNSQQQQQQQQYSQQQTHLNGIAAANGTGAIQQVANHSSEGGFSSSETESSESSSEEYIHQHPSSKQLQQQQSQSMMSKTNQNMNGINNHPLQFVCVEVNCGEPSKLCCAKCLSSGNHENHEAICLKTLDAQIKAIPARSTKLNTLREGIRSHFSSLIAKINVCQETVLAQFNIACETLEKQADRLNKHLNSKSKSHENQFSKEESIESSLRIWKAFYQPECSPMLAHLNFIVDQSEIFLNAIQARTSNLIPQSLLFAKPISSADLLFQRQLKSVEEELSKAELNLSSRARQSLSVLPQFSFTNPEFENIHAVSVKKFEFEERIEFAQVNRDGEQCGRSLIFWDDGAYRIGYTQNGQSQGICRMIWENGNVYEGSYVNDKKHGSSCSFIKFADNSSFIGEFANDAKNGHGKEYYRNATHYIGAFKNWKPHGYGELIHSQTQQILKSGTWKNGKFTAGENHIHPNHHNHPSNQTTTH